MRVGGNPNISVEGTTLGAPAPACHSYPTDSGAALRVGQPVGGRRPRRARLFVRHALLRQRVRAHEHDDGGSQAATVSELSSNLAEVAASTRELKEQVRANSEGMSSNRAGYIGAAGQNRQRLEREARVWRRR